MLLDYVKRLLNFYRTSIYIVKIKIDLIDYTTQSLKLIVD